jgi:hypothetical protein
MERLLGMYTNANVCGVLLFPWMPEPVQDVIRASTLLILVAVATVWFSGNLIEVYHDLVDSFTPTGWVIPDSIKTGIMVFYDALFHVVPFLILGLPYYIGSLFVAYGMLVLWFILMRHRLPSIYSSKVSFDRGIGAAGVVGLAVVVWLGWER